MVLTDNRFTLKRKQKPVADQKNSPIQFRRIYNGDKDYFKEKESQHMDVSLLFTLLSRRAGSVTSNQLCPDSLRLGVQGRSCTASSKGFPSSHAVFSMGKEICSGHYFYKYWSLFLLMHKADVSSTRETLFMYFFFFLGSSYWSTKFHLVFTSVIQEMEETKFVFAAL